VKKTLKKKGEECYQMKTYIKNQLICQKLNMIKEYGRIKKKESKYFKTAKEMCKFYGISRKTFYKWLNRYNKSNKDPNSLLPQSTRPKTIRKRKSPGANPHR